MSRQPLADQHLVHRGSLPRRRIGSKRAKGVVPDVTSQTKNDLPRAIPVVAAPIARARSHHEHRCPAGAFENVAWAVDDRAEAFKLEDLQASTKLAVPSTPGSRRFR